VHEITSPNGLEGWCRHQTAFSLAINATGTVKLKTTVLMTTAEVDEAAKRKVDYRAPGK